LRLPSNPPSDLPLNGVDQTIIGEDLDLMKIRKRVREGKIKELSIEEDVLWYRNPLCVLNTSILRKKLPKEAYNSMLTSHLRSIKMYHNSKIYF